MSFCSKSLSVNFENYIGNLISKFLSGDEILYKEYPFEDIMYTPDYYLPKGCKNLGWNKRTAIEVKNSLCYDNIARTYQYALQLLEKNKIDNFVLIFYNISDLINPKKFVNAFKDRRFKVVNYNVLVYVAKYSNIIIPVFDSNYIPNDEEINNKIIDKDLSTLDKARKSFQNNNYSLFLGAGLSMDAKLPSWNKLIESLLINNDNQPFNNINEANSCAISETFGNSSIIAGRYVYDGYKRAIQTSTKGEEQSTEDLEDIINSLFVKRLRKSLYVENNHKSKLVTSVANAIKLKSPKQIITYNFDDLLEEELNDKAKYYSICDKHIPRTDCVPIYHVHGMVSRKESIRSRVVLSEKEYHRLYSNPYNWANIIQLHSLNTTSCFFIGFSMTDPNQRRLLEIARNEAGSDLELTPHYVFLKKNPLKGEASKAVNEEHWEEVEEMMKDFGLNVIWFKEFTELPELIDYISCITDKKPNSYSD